MIATDKVLIVGTGAMANLFGARLSAAGIDVTLLGTWKEGLEALRGHGIRLESPNEVKTFPVHVAGSPSEVDTIRFALVLVKSWQTARAAEQLSGILADDGLALSLQNGLGNQEILSQKLGDSRVAQGVTTTGATLLGPGHVRPGGEGTISVSTLPRLDSLVGMLRRADFEVKRVVDVQSLLWRKLLINVAINPLTAIFNVPNGDLLRSASARQLMRAAIQEVGAVAASKSIPLGFSDPVAAAEDVARKTASNRSSMLQDLTRGAPTEIEAICGAVLRASQEAGIAAPVNRVMYLSIKSIVELQGT